MNADVILVGRKHLTVTQKGQIRDRCLRTNPTTGEWNFECLGVTSIDCVIHLATKYVVDHDPTNIGDLFDDNVRFSGQLIDAVARFNPHFIAAESYWQYAAGSQFYRANNLYAATKIAAAAIFDHYVEAHGLRVSKVVIGDTYGMNDGRSKLIYALLEAAHSGATISLGSPDHCLAPVHVNDVVDGLMKVMSAKGQERGVPINLCGKDVYSLRELVEIVADICNRPIDVTWGKNARRAGNLPPWTEGVLAEGWSQAVQLRDGLNELWKERCREVE